MSTAFQELTCDFSQIIHKFIHRELSWQVTGEHESREEAVISRDALLSGGREVTLMRITC